MRRSTHAGWPSWALIGALVTLFVHLQVVLYPPVDAAAQQWTASLIYVLTFLLAGLACLRNAPRHGQDAPAWRTLAWGLLAFALGQVIYTHLLLVRHLTPFPSLADAPFLTALALYAASISCFRSPLMSPLERARIGIDVGLIVTATCVALAPRVLPDVLSAYAGQPAALLIGLAYPLGDLVVLSAFLLSTVRRGVPFSARELLLAGGFLCLIVADQAFLNLSAAGRYAPGVWADLFWSLGAALLAGASALRPDLPVWRVRSRLNLPLLPTFLPYLALLVPFTPLLGALRLGRAPDPLHVWGATLMTALVVGRQVVAFQVIAALGAQLRGLSAQLEARVQERTTQLTAANRALADLADQLDVKVQERTAELESSRAQLLHQAQHDALTGLPNRALFLNHLQRAVALAARDGRSLGVLFADLDGFKAVNDTFGHATGDEVLRQVAARLGACVASGDLVARLSGDEFTVILPGRTAAELDRVGRRLVRALERPFLVDGQRLSVSGSVGAVLYPQDGADADTLTRHADAAMYRAKADGRNCLRFYDPVMERELHGRQALLQALKQAVHDEQFTLVYQPQVNVQTGALEGAEALLRWTRADGQVIAPATFITLAEQSGVMVPLGRWALRHACEQAARWHRAGRELRVAVNVSAVQFQDAGFVQSVRVTLCETGLPAALLELEVTESLLMQDVPRVQAALRELKALGVRLAIDGFGTGYSSLSYLQVLPIDTLKIDRSFLPRPGEEASQAGLRAVVGLGQALHMQLVAEGVETGEQRRAVQALGCVVMQGFHFAQPMPVTALEAWRDAWAEEQPGRPGT